MKRNQNQLASLRKKFLKFVKRNPKFQPIAVFIVVFGVIGTFLVIHSFADGTTGLTTPTNLAYVTAAVDDVEAPTTTTITLSWGASTDSGGPGLGGYILYRNSSAVATIPLASLSDPSSPTYTDSDLTAGTTYTYSVAAYDTSNTDSTTSSSITATTSTLIGDLDGDCSVTGHDLSILLSSYGTNSPRAEFDGTSTVEGHDLSMLLTNYGHSVSCGSGSTTNGPINTAIPTVTGSTIVGSTLTTSDGSWSDSPSSYSFQWQDCIGQTCSNISGATNSTYTVESSDIGHSLSAVVTADDGSGTTSINSYNTAAAAATTVSKSNFVSESYWLGWSPPSGCSSWSTTCLTTTTPFNFNAYNRIMLFNYANQAPTQNATTTGSTITLGSTITSIPATVSTAIPAGPIMLTTDPTTPSSGSYQIVDTSGASSGATSIPITGSPTANANYASGSAAMVFTPNAVNWRWPDLSSLVTLAHSKGAQVWVSMGGEGDNWNVDCDNGFQYLTGAWYANFISANNLDGFNEDNESSQTSAEFTACANAIGQEVHSVATYAGQVPGVEIDWNATDNVPASASVLATTITNIDAYELEYYGNDPSNDYNCADNCGGTGVGTPSTSLADGVSAGIPAEKWIDIYAPGNPDSPLGAQASSTLLSNTTSSVSGSVSSIPISGVAAAGSEAAGTIPAGLFVISDTGSPPSTWEYLETTGVTGCTSDCSVPVTGSCTAAGWKVDTDTCTNSAATTLNASYSSGADIWFDEIGYPQGGYNTGGWDCGTMTAWASANNLLGSSTWYWDGTENGQVCNNTIQPFVP